MSDTPNPIHRTDAVQDGADIDAPIEQYLLDQACDHITREFGGNPPALQVSIENRRIRLAGKVRDADIAQRVAKAAAIGPGVLGVHNDLEIEVTDAPSTQPLPGSQAAADLSKEAPEHGVPLPPPEGPIHHKV